MEKKPSSNLLLTGYEKRLLSGREKSAADLLQDTQIAKNTLKKYLSLDIEYTDENGDTQSAPMIDILIAKKVSWWMEHISKFSPEDVAKVLGELNTKVDVNVTGAKEVFKKLSDMAIDENDNKTE